MKNLLDVVSGPFEPHAVRITTRKRQKLSLAAQPDEVLYLIRKGLYLSRAPIPHARHQVLGILYPGDLVRTLAVPPLEGAEIMAASEKGEVWRLRWPAVKALMDERHDLARIVSDRLADQAARGTLHNAVIAGLTGDERVAALMVELALRTGKETAAGLVFEMPLSRMDIAEHLALNPDTVSRIVSRMRAKGLLAAAGRRHLVCPSFDELAQSCPLTSTIARMHKVDRLLPA
ncbi:Crp/Fnr family transcriptional regulator [Hyphomicrobium sp.]|uniref:Crp/Fnr family transcriptional regulator n=1 Tax=Hyphomicrobium sp. TaxID=82 RepID=UPI0025BD4BE3|nr:Crp/Fnr family transcriptional regulator [Hyphomicrobium sp.]MCC7252708.1 Crp/Fnr family transcriptional regulator [Hyphomicrobium sp.]